MTVLQRCIFNFVVWYPMIASTLHDLYYKNALFWNRSTGMVLMLPSFWYRMDIMSQAYTTYFSRQAWGLWWWSKSHSCSSSLLQSQTVWYPMIASTLHDLYYKNALFWNRSTGMVLMLPSFWYRMDIMSQAYTTYFSRQAWGLWWWSKPHSCSSSLLQSQTLCTLSSLLFSWFQGW